MSDGGMLVTKVSTGVLFLEDIRVNVAHGESVHISADKVCNSRDLYRAINAKELQVLVTALPSTPKIVETPMKTQEVSVLEAENQALRAALDRSTRQSETLQGSMQGVEAKLNSLLEAISRGAVQTALPIAQGYTPPKVVGVVEEAPIFIPPVAIVDDSNIRFDVHTEVSEGSQASETASKLRKLRNKT